MDAAIRRSLLFTLAGGSWLPQPSKRHQKKMTTVMALLREAIVVSGRQWHGHSQASENRQRRQ